MYKCYFIEHRISHKWLTERYIGYEFTSDLNEALAFYNWDAANDYLEDLKDRNYFITEHEFVITK